jgi:eukaryotic-like serine/threonine-protein kinase
MNLRRWEEVARIYDAATALGTAERDAFLRGACADDSGLRREVESLFAHDQHSTVLNRPPSAVPGWPADDETPHVFGYAVEVRLGAGSYGEVWRATDLNTRRRVAIKFFTRAAGLDLAVLKHEVSKLLEMVTERRVVQLLRVGWDAQPPYYVMEFVPGGSLADRLATKPLAIDEAVSVFRGVAEALTYLHGKAILHCDLKPANVLLDERREVRLADFGQARRTTESGLSLGTFFYMAPEQGETDARPDVRTDIYALGALAYAMLTGAPPYASRSACERMARCGSTAERLQLYRRIIDESPVPQHHRLVTGMDGLFADIVDRCLEPDPAQRFESVPHVLKALEARERQRTRRPLVLLGLVGSLAVATLLAGVGLWVRGQAMADAKAAVTVQTLENVIGYTTLVATVVDRNLSAVRRQVERVADSEEVARLLLAAANGARDSVPALQRTAESLYDEFRERSIFNWVLADADAVVLARAPFDSGVVGRRYAYREWFTGIPDVAAELAPAFPAPRQTAGITRAFQSTAAGSPLLVSVASPVWAATPGEGKRVIGVVSATLHLATFNAWLAEAEGPPNGLGCPERFAILLNHGQLLRHPCPTTGVLLPVEPAVYFDRAQVQRLRSTGSATEFADPVREGEPFVAAMAALDENPDWHAIVQLDRSKAMAPVASLDENFRLIGALAGGTGLLTLLGLWALLYVLTREPASGPASHSDRALGP